MNNDIEQIFILNASQSQPSSSTQKTVGVDLPGEPQVNLENVEDFSNVCRTCATITEFVIPIFSGEGLQNNLADKIHKHLPIQVSSSDTLPRVVCYQCASTLLAWHELVQCCQQADIALRARLAQQETTENQTSTSNVEEEHQSKIIITQVKVEEEPRVAEEIPKPELLVGEDGKRYAKCSVCRRSVSVGGWRRHARAHRSERRHSCAGCGRTFSDSGNLARHVRTHRDHRPYSCQVCSKTFTRSSHLEDHVRSHSETRDFVCEVCGKASKSLPALRMHRRRHAAPAHGCVSCGAQFVRRCELRAHLRVHTGERAHVCACGAAFRLRAQLTLHNKQHHNTEEQ